MTTSSQSKSSSGIPPFIQRHAAMPVFLILVCVALYLYIGTQDLDTIEQRAISAGTIFTAVFEHIQLAGLATLLVVLLAVTTGILVTRPALRRITPIAVNIGNIGQAIPSIGLLVLIAILYSTGFTSAVFGLIAYAFLPVLRNTMVGLQQVDPSVVESARGNGYVQDGYAISHRATAGRSYNARRDKNGSYLGRWYRYAGHVHKRRGHGRHNQRRH